ncbi:type ISP restriction/modification enzyme [uncultured Ilyobacter sp.]|uniref:type ISP restriction/modification enzyme n=1 Tax=uncultured Ilyobacter sp. TaxID=544433 RepID=UPI0029C0165C|nr:type ISP restriction/modification enzyme [uncultured Ilyobacter sp.]
MGVITIILKYINKLDQKYTLGNSTEHTFRGDLQDLIESLVPNILATNEPKRIKCGAPDYLITKKNSQIPIGYIEAKDIGLDLMSKTLKEQFERYKGSLENLIITDYLKFQVYTNGEFKYETKIGEIKKGKIVALEENFSSFESLIKGFCEYSGQTIKSPKQLAIMMADKAKMLQHIIVNALTDDEENDENSTLKEQMNAFREILIHNINAKDFSDIYAQTIAYGMFAARLEDPTLETFSRQEAAELIPKSNPFLRKLFQYIAGYDLDERIVWIVDALADIFRATDIKELLKNFGKTTQMNDPIIHFYEDFLIEYDPKLRKKRGVWYTPSPIVSFIVRAVDEVLKKDFNFELGIADYSKTKIKVDIQGKKGLREVHKIQVLDPATGTGTFLSEIIRFIYSKYFEGQQGSWNTYVEEHLIPRLHGFELLMTSYAMAHLKLEMLLKETGYEFKKNKRLGIYLTNSLEEHHPDMATLFAGWLSEEANSANFIKRDTPIMCVLGNPPYSGESFNKGKWVMKLMEDYKKEPGGKIKLNERNPKWINDDYVKFIRYAQYYIDKNKEGVLAYINPHGFLDNPTFRGMRWKLLSSFDKIYTIDLHGNSNKKETCPDGTVDQNVFDIQQGVSINIFIKTGKTRKNQLAEVFHWDCYGTREVKFDFLNNNSLNSINFKKLKNVAPDYFMVPKDYSLKKKYDKGFSLNELFLSSSVGIVTSKDKILVNADKNKLIYNVEKHYKDKVTEENIKNISYRPFDVQYIYYDIKKIERPRQKVMCHMIDNDNISFVSARSNKSENCDHFFISKYIMDAKFGERTTQSNMFPLYTYFETSDDKFAFMKGCNREPNLKLDIIDEISKKIKIIFTKEKETGETFAPIDILDYVYAVLHSPSYREKYKAFLKIDYPKVPYPKNLKEFNELVAIGSKLRDLHLMKKIDLSNIKISFPNSGDNIIEKPRFKNGKVYINSTQFFENVSDTAWNFYIGGYQPAQKWLKDRKNEVLRFEDINHYKKICFILEETNRLMKGIDNIYNL